MNKDLIFYYKRGLYISADEIRAKIAETGTSIDDISFVIIKEKYNGNKFVEYNKIYSTGINRDISNDLIAKNKEKRILMYQRKMIPQFLKDKLILINAKIERLQNEIDALYKQRSMNINTTKGDLLKNVGNKNIPEVVNIEELPGTGVPNDFVERPNATKYSVIFYNKGKFSFIWDTPVLNSNPFPANNSKFLNEITKRRENITSILKRKQQ